MVELNRRHLLGAAAAGTAVALAGGGTAVAGPRPGGATARAAAAAAPRATQPFTADAVTLLPSAFRDNMGRNTAYLRFVDIDRLLHTFRLNVGLPSSAQPCGGWEGPDVELRGHSTGHLLSGLALTHAATGDQELLTKSRELVAALAECQAASPGAGYGDGYLSAFPESFFDRLESGSGVWAPYYTIHKILAGLIDQYTLTGNEQALDLALAKGGWVDGRTAALSRQQMQAALATEFGGMMESLADLYTITGDDRWLDVAERFSHDAVFNPLADGQDRLAGLHANTQIPKMVGAMRVWEEGRAERYRTIGENFWQIVTDHHTYVIGGNSNGEGFHDPDEIAGQLSGSSCENCNSYNMLKLTRLMHFHAPERVDLLDYYERTLFNQMLGEQDPDSAHGFCIYYTGLQPGAYKRQPSFMGGEDQYSTDYGNFSCDHGTGMETHAKFNDTIYSHSADTLTVNLFVPSEVTWSELGIGWRQTTGFPDGQSVTLTVVSGGASHTLRVRIPSWAEGAEVSVAGEPAVGAEPGTWFSAEREWATGDTVEVALPMRLVTEPTPDDPDVQAVLFGPTVLAGAYGDQQLGSMPRLDFASVTREPGDQLLFTGVADDEEIELLPIARVHHQRYNTYWLTGTPVGPPPAFAAWHTFDEGSGNAVLDATGNGAEAALVGGVSRVAGRSGGAVSLNGTDGHVRLADDVLAGAQAWSFAAWVRLDGTPATWSRIVDIGSGATANLFLTPRADSGRLRFAITSAGGGAEQRIEADPLPTNAWTHVALSAGQGAVTLYVNGAQVGRNGNVTVVPAHFANHLRSCYLGRSQYPDPYLRGALDDVRIYGRTLTAAEVADLAEG
jgi:DUF1680 family protein